MGHGAEAFSGGYFYFVAYIIVARLIEQRLPADPTPPGREFIFDYAALAIRLLAGAGIKSLYPAAALLLINSLGGGIIALSSRGWGFVASLAVYLLAYDLNQYVLHRLSHRIPFLWSMHSFHHSTRVVTVTAGLRHFWSEELIGIPTDLLFGLIFVVPIEVIAVAAPIRTVMSTLLHVNVRIGYGPLSLLINGPQYHRIHHSVQPEHIDTNFAELFPVWDVLFGTVFRPRPGEFPLTGLETGEVPTRSVDVIAWPLRNVWPLRRASS
jgi:sterol desaturase/sphingolipid hydroxylase (fatty acid hydroxylase superfamily)